ncbi:MAG: extracellular solute-binding protein [Lachnospiraceae bacterium]|nr:extracellular solute-binding protein [Lachnospiraceae bacterium]
MKRFVSILLVIIFIMGLCACSKQGSSGTLNGTETLTLALRDGTYSEVIKADLEEFENKNNVTCEVLELSEEELYNYVLNTDEDHPLDLCMVDGSWVTECIEKDSLIALDEYDYSLDQDIIPATTVISYYDNQLYVAPFYGNVTVLFYNKEAVKATGYSIEELSSAEKVYQACSDSQKKGKAGFLYRGDTNNNIVVDFLPVLLTFGGWVVDEENNPIINSDEFKSALEYYLNLIHTGKACEKEELIKAIASGEATMAVGWPGWYIPSDISPADYCALEGRANAEAPSYNANVYGIWTLGVSSKSQHKESAVALLAYLMDKDVQMDSIVMGGIPCRYSCLTDENVLSLHPEYEEVCQALEMGHYRPMISSWNEFSDILGGYMNKTIQGEISVSECAEKAQSDLEKLLREK